MSEAIYKFEPHRNITLGGFDRRGCTAALHSASTSGFTVSGVYSDLADFVVLRLFDADDNFGHLFTTRYLPDFDLTAMAVEFDLAITNGMYPGSKKFPSVPWDSLSWIQKGGTRGTTPLNITATTGDVAATTTFTLAGTPTTFDRVQLVYLGNVVYDSANFSTPITTGQTLATVAANMAAYINSLTSPSVPLSASSSGATVTVACTQPGQDGNTIELLTMYKAAGNTSISPALAKLTGGVDPTSFHVKLDFPVMGLTSLRQCWLTLAPSLPIDSGGTNPTLVPFTAKEFSYVFSNWTITDPSSHKPLKIAGPGSVVVGSRDGIWVTYAGSGWAEQEGFYYHGFARQSAHSGDSVTIKYSCQSTHDLYLGTVLGFGNGTFAVTLDGVAQANRSTALEGALSGDSPIPSRRILASGVSAGTHTVVLTLASSAVCWFDYLQAAVLSDVQSPSVTHPTINAACDFDTGYTGQRSPGAGLWGLQKMGFTGDLDFYAGVFFEFKRVRVGGNFHQATVTLSGTFAPGSGFGGTDAIFVTIGGVTVGAAMFPADTLDTLAQRLIDGINGLFVGVAAAPTGTTGQFTITTLSPINGFTLSVSAADTSTSPPGAASGTVAVTGDILAGNEGTWGVDASQSSPLNKAFVDYLADLAALMHAAGQTMTVAFSQELLAPPDVNTSGGAWSQRFADGTTVLTATGFGSWGAGFIDGLVSGVYQQIGHGYVTGNLGHFADGGSGGVWKVVVTDADHYTLGTQISNTGGYTPGIGDSVLIELQTTQCNFNPSTVTPYLQKCYVQAANILGTASLTPWLQFGEVGWWFFSERMSQPIGFASWTSPIAIGTMNPHGYVTGQTVINAGVKGNTAANGTWPIVVTDSTHYQLTGSSGNGAYIASTGTSSGGGMAYYDAYTSAAAVIALGHALASFYSQDDDPSGHSADIAFLAGQIYTHISTIVAAVLAARGTAKFELLYPLDVNFPSCYYSADLPFPQGGRLNAAVNLPSQFHVKAGSALNRFKIECLSMQATYFNHDIFVEAVRFPYTVLGWAKADTACLIGWFNGSCPWMIAEVFVKKEGIPLVNKWAADHGPLLDWPPASEPYVTH